MLVYPFALNAQTVDFTFSSANNLFCDPQTVTFTQAATGNPTSFVWDFGDGQSGSTSTATIMYSNAGTYNVTLTAIYASNAISVTKTVVINPSPVIDLSADKIALCQPGIVNFTGVGSAFLTSYEWNFGDGSPIQTTASNTVSHNFTSYNTFTIRVKGITAAGCNASDSIDIVIAKFGISGTVTPSSGCKPVNALLSLTMVFPSGNSIQNIIWNFGDGSSPVSGSTSTINHLYNTTSIIFGATVDITSNQGCTNQYTFSPFAYGIPPTNIQAYTIAMRDTFCGSETIQFFGKADSANSYSWDFGDGIIVSTTDTIISHRYRVLGNRRVIVTPSYNGCPGTPDTLNIFIKGVIANYSYVNTCANKNTYFFTNTSLGNISHYEWTFTDVPAFKDSTNYNISHAFPGSGSFVSRLLTIDYITGCRDSLDANIFTANPSLTSSGYSVCKDSSVVYTVNNTYPATSGHTYEYHYNGRVANLGPASIFTFPTTTYGMFNDYVVILDTIPGTCNDTLYIPQSLIVRGPIVDFNIPTAVCIGKTAVITNLTYPFFSADSIVQWKWNFGDNKRDSIRNPPPHLYPTAGLQYTISLMAMDMYGCSQSISHILITRGLPVVVIFPAIDTLCSGSVAELRAFTADTLLWSPNTNINCTTCDTVLVSPTVTTQYIARATDIFGCINYDTSLVKVFNPFNLAVYPGDTSVCPKMPVQYNLNTGGAITWTPSLYLNNTTIRNPIAIPDTSVIYRVVVQDSVGCFSDTAFANLHVYGKPMVNAGPDRFLSYGTAFTLSPAYSGNISTYSWTPTGVLSCDNCATPSGIALKKETFTIAVSDINGCRFSDSVTIFVNCEKSNLLLPTAFTPNKDGRNDYLYPLTRGYKEIKSFIVYNRFGVKVFENKNFEPNIPSLGWDGKVKSDSHVSTQSFVWIVEGVCDSGELITTKGSVILIH